MPSFLAALERSPPCSLNASTSFSLRAVSSIPFHSPANLFAGVVGIPVRDCITFFSRVKWASNGRSFRLSSTASGSSGDAITAPVATPFPCCFSLLPSTSTSVVRSIPNCSAALVLFPPHILSVPSIIASRTISISSFSLPELVHPTTALACVSPTPKRVSASTMCPIHGFLPACATQTAASAWTSCSRFHRSVSVGSPAGHASTPPAGRSTATAAGLTSVPLASSRAGAGNLLLPPPGCSACALTVWPVRPSGSSSSAVMLSRPWPTAIAAAVSIMLISSRTFPSNGIPISRFNASASRHIQVPVRLPYPSSA